jgi:hypothetical protein
MSKRRSKIAKSEENNGGGEVKERKFIKLLKTDIQHLKIGSALKRLGNIQVIEWDFRSRKEPVGAAATEPLKKAPKRKVKSKDLKALTASLKNFLEYLVINLVDEPLKSKIDISEISPGVLRLKLVLVKRDVAMLVGRDGLTAEPIRSLLKSMGKKNGVDVLLKIVSHEENNSLAQRDA